MSADFRRTRLAFVLSGASSFWYVAAMCLLVTLVGAQALIMGASRRSALAKALRGDVLQEVARHLPKEIPVLIYS